MRLSPPNALHLRPLLFARSPEHDVPLPHYSPVRHCIAPLAALVSALRTQLQLPVFGLCDWNPFGLALLLSYKIGSVTGGAEASRYAVPSMAWLGLRAAQIDRLQRKEGIELSSKPFSPVDRRKVQSMLRNNQFLGETQNAEWRQELEAMQERGIKVDLEAVLELERGFEIFSEEVVQQELLSENAIA